MNFKDYIIENKSMSELNEVELELFVDFILRREKELEPDDPLPDRNVIEKMFTEKRPYEDSSKFFAWDKERSKLIAHASIGKSSQSSPQYESNKHRCWGDVEVDEKFRNQGLGSYLLIKLLEKVIEWDKESLDIYCIEESGHNFYKAKGIGIEALSGIESRVYFSDMDWDLMQEWNAIGEKLAGEVKLHTFVEVPEVLLEDFCKAYTVMENLVPKGEQDWKALITPESRRELEKRMRERKTIWLTKMTEERNGALSGITEVHINEESAFWASQELTAVIPQYRGRGLGKWLKANMALYLKENYPNIKFIQTGNADVNAPMLAINTQMGFKPHRKYVSYKIGNADIQRFLQTD